MMMHIFLIFDPSSSNNMSWNWVSLFMMMFIFSYQFWLINSRYTMFWSMMFLYIFNELKMLTKYNFSNLIIFISLIYMILINNFMGLFPYIFTASSHMSLNMSISLSMSVGLMMYSLYNYFNLFMAHLMPLNTPVMLMSFMVIIESISILIRPFTLSIRLTANMISGHLLLSLLNNFSMNLNMFMFMLIMTIQLMLIILEISVSMIQAYVFSTLLTLYTNEC